MILGVDNARRGIAGGKSAGPKGNLLYSSSGQSEITRGPTANRIANLSRQALNIQIVSDTERILPVVTVVVVVVVVLVVVVVVVV